MSRDEFLAALATLVGGGRGMLSRASRLYGFSTSTLMAIDGGRRPVPARYAEAVGQALADADKVGGWLARVTPRLESVLSDAEAAGGQTDAVVAAIAAWAALRLVRAHQ